MKGRLLAFAPLLVLLALGAATAVVLFQGGARQDLGSQGLLGQPIPRYELSRLDGGPAVTPAEFQGPYLVNFYASWCAPCRVEHPELMRLAEAGVPILGVAYKDDPEAARRFLNDLGDPFAAVGLDRDGRYGLEIGIAGVPETFVIGADGTIKALHRGPLDAETAGRLLAEARAG